MMSRPRNFALAPWQLACVGVLLVLARPADATPVSAAPKPGAAWQTFETRTLDDVPAMADAPEDAVDAYGGINPGAKTATGYFRTERIGGRWWLIDPLGGTCIHRGVVAVTRVRTAAAEQALQARFGDDKKWAVATTAWLHHLGFNGAGAWSDTDALRATPTPLVYTRVWPFLGAYVRQRDDRYGDSAALRNPPSCACIFDPEFEQFCEDYARQLAAKKNDPWLLGHFADGDLALRRDVLKACLELGPHEPGCRAARAWLEARHGAAAGTHAIDAADQQAFLQYVVDRYLRIVSRAVRKNDPNHLFLGPRLAIASARLPEVVRAARPYVDVISVNYYRDWTPDPALLAMWERESGHPCLVTEYNAKAMDVAGLANASGGGWVVRTQADRGRFYDNFTLGLLASRVCVGWHWSQYADNDPGYAKADPANRDANKGLVSARYDPYVELTRAMRRLNTRVYALIASIDRGSESR